MAQVIVKLTGGAPSMMEAVTVGDLKKSLGKDNFQATVNGIPQEDSYTLAEMQAVILTEKQKGAC